MSILSMKSFTFVSVIILIVTSLYFAPVSSKVIEKQDKIPYLKKKSDWEVVTLDPGTLMAKLFPSKVIGLVVRKRQTNANAYIFKISWRELLGQKACRKIFQKLETPVIEGEKVGIENLTTFNTRYGRACELTWNQSKTLKSHYLAFFKKRQSTYGFAHNGDEPVTKETAQKLRKVLKSLR